MKITKKSLDTLRNISDTMFGKTFHHHYHILLDIASSYKKKEKINYLEIGCYAGASACLMLQRPNTSVISIDLGYPISEKVVYQNIEKFNTHKNEYRYIRGNSNDQTILKEVTDFKVDILFIDGDHSYSAVKNDFINYSSLVVSGGYIVFDDYHDSQHSPEVHKAVNDIVSEVKDQYDIIGTFKNEFAARPENLLDGNCFVMRKL